MARAKLFIVMFLLISTVTRSVTFAVRNMPGLLQGSSSVSLTTHDDQASPLCSTSQGSSRRLGSVSMSKVFFAIANFNIDHAIISTGLFSIAPSDFVSYALATPSRPPSV